MTGSELWLRDSRLAPLAVSAFPAWLWSADATRILWANPTGAAIFGANSAAALGARSFDPGQPASAQVIELAKTLVSGDAPRIERLRGFGAGVGRTLTCACSQVKLDDGVAAILLVAAERAGPDLTLAERVQRLLAGAREPVAAFAADGQVIHAIDEQSQRLEVHSLAELGAQAPAAEALKTGHAVGNTLVGPIELRRMGAEAEPVLIATFPASLPAEKTDDAITSPVPPSRSELPAPAKASEAASLPTPGERRYPLRFVWQMDAESRFTVGSEEFIALMGPRTATLLDRPWRQIAQTHGVDPDDHIVHAISTQDTWSGLIITWPVDDGPEGLEVELSGLPVFDRDRMFRGYRGFGVCRDLVRLTALARARHAAQLAAPTAEENDGDAPVMSNSAFVQDAAPANANAEAGENVVPFRPVVPPEAPSLTPVERRAFRELARRLTERLTDAGVEYKGSGDHPLPTGEPADPTLTDLAEAAKAAADPLCSPADDAAASPADDLFQPLVPYPGASAPAAPATVTPAQMLIFDRLPVGVLVYRHSELFYANRAFLTWTGYDNLAALTAAGGLDSLFIEPGAMAVDQSGSKSFALMGSSGDQLMVEGRMFKVPWEGDTAFALVTTPVTDASAAQAARERAQAEAAELKSILDTATDGVIVLDREGRILSASRSAEALFGYEARDLVGRAFTELFAPESERIAFDYLDRLKRNSVASILNDGREVIGRVREGGLIPLFMTLGRVGESAKFCAVLRDITPWKKAEEELIESKRQAAKASTARSEFLAKVSHEIRTPLNAIIGFAEVMLEERFGPLRNDRYREYINDIHASGAHTMALVNDLLDLSKIEAGKLDLAFTSIALNELTQQCVAAMQPQANKERIIIRTALAPKLPPVIADERSLRQIVQNLLSHSIKSTGTGAQIIVSTALTDAGEVALRVRDTGAGMSDQDIATTFEPFRPLATSGHGGGTGLGLPLSKALAEANRATFRIKSSPKDGTLVEVTFPATRVLAG